MCTSKAIRQNGYNIIFSNLSALCFRMWIIVDPLRRTHLELRLLHYPKHIYFKLVLINSPAYGYITRPLTFLLYIRALGFTSLTLSASGWNGFLPIRSILLPKPSQQLSAHAIPNVIYSPKFYNVNCNIHFLGGHGAQYSRHIKRTTSQLKLRWKASL